MKGRIDPLLAVQMCLQLKILITSVIGMQDNMLKSYRLKLYQPHTHRELYIYSGGTARVGEPALLERVFYLPKGTRRKCRAELAA